MKSNGFVLVSGFVTALFLLPAQPVTSAEVDDQQAEDLLLEMARTIAAAKQFSVTVRSGFDAPQEDGQMIEFRALRKIQVRRPDELRVDLQRSDGKQRMFLSDGRQIIVHSATENVYAMVEQPGNVDETVRHMVSVLKIPMPLARMFSTTFPAELERLIEEVSYVEQDILTDVPTSHLAIRARDTDVQIWVAEGKVPLPRRIVITYKNYAGEPQFRADFSDWKLSADAVTGPFTFTPPDDAEKIPLLIRQDVAESATSPEGGVQ
jgi:hypothetical protein